MKTTSGFSLVLCLVGNVLGCSAQADPVESGGAQSSGKSDSGEQALECGSVIVPQVGTAARTGIIKALRDEVGPAVRELGSPKFIFSTIRFDETTGFAVAMGSLCLPVGNECIEITTEQLASTAAYGPLIEEERFDGNRFEALVQIDADGNGRVLSWDLGATDAFWIDWPGRFGASTALVFGCEFASTEF